MQAIRKSLLICYVRHGQTFDNVDQIIAGHNPGKLTKIGIDQAHQTGTALKDAEFDYIYVSDLNRTRQTYEGIISKAKKLQNLKVEFTPLIREKCGGILQGKKTSAWPQTAKKNNIPLRQFKCEKGQSWINVNERSLKFLHQLIKTHLSPSQTQTNQLQSTKASPNLIRILVVTHGGFIMQTHNVMNFLKDKKQPVFMNTAKNCSFHQFQIGYNGTSFDPIDNNKITVVCTKNNITHY